MGWRLGLSVVCATTADQFTGTRMTDAYDCCNAEPSHHPRNNGNCSHQMETKTSQPGRATATQRLATANKGACQLCNTYLLTSNVHENVYTSVACISAGTYPPLLSPDTARPITPDL
ncbi:hypothetical protein P153DRAFT_369695 [Dothidotthia symphoricarpi CBS 119687]|uniref:Uncharacterized protein n=1 Tax=Dothidotthia symphoricarpi CBS 119687 TaxID=1392245 RepID=A0A6A6A3J6_9PLEO|nr:uncharacterized protein P153DRAFT_369695 [Dothidotthia symphoricarpi CBS 119687]KAF2125684.1 hypothetical protein P153DRAFT_369695 [Dothidotthia symphoricarpi CBS 119687]